MNVHEIIAMVVAGAAAGFMNALAGGGTIITFPVLLFVGMNSVEANATSTVALIVGIVGSIYGYRDQFPAVKKKLFEFAPVSVLGGLIGGVLLTFTPVDFFDRLVPFLILFATLLFMVQGVVIRWISPEGGHFLKRSDGGVHWGAQVFQFFIALYGGYFGAGIGILMLATLGFVGLSDIYQMNAVKTILGGLINLVAAVYFIGMGMVDWTNMAYLAIGAVPGYYFGARFSQSIPRERARQMVVLIGFLIAAYMFYEKFLK